MTHAFTQLLLATEHSEQDAGAEALAFAMAQRCGLPLAAVLPIVSNPEYEALAPQLAGRLARVLVREGAQARRADLLVIRRRGKRGLLANLLVGDMVRNVVTHSPCSVLVVPRASQMWTRRVLVALDPATADMTPVATAAAIAAECAEELNKRLKDKQLGADLIVIGRHGGDSLSRAWLGGVAQKVIGLAEEPVLVAVTSLSPPGAHA